MTSLDFLVAGILIASTLVGLLRGLAKEVISLAAWVLAFLLAKSLAPSVTPLMPGAGAPGLQYAAALVLVFLLVLLVASLLGYLIRQAIEFAGLGIYDRIFGAAFGVARGVVAVVGLALVASLTALPKTQFWQTSLCHARLEQAVLQTKPWLPKDMAAHVQI